jgi:hypothetical protein
MGKAGESMVKRPIVPLLILMVVTVASLGMIASNPPSFEMDQESFMPDNELTRASAVIQESFTSSASMMSMVDASGAGGNIFTTEVFVDILGYEKALSEMRYEGIDGNDHAYSDLPVFQVISPVSVIAQSVYAVWYQTTFGTPPPAPADYDTLIMVIGGMSSAELQVFSAGVLSDPQSEMLLAMLTNDLDVFFDPDMPFGTVSARGCMVTVIITDDEIELMLDGKLGFEGDVIAIANGFSPSTGVSIRAIGMWTMMSEIGTLAQQDIGMLIPIALVVIVTLLLIIYRDVFDTLIAILGIVIAVIWTFGISALFGVQMSTIAIAVPILILALGIDYSLHLVFRYREERISGKDIKGAIARTFGSVGEALILATVTTAIAFLSYLTSSMSALADFGLMCAIGIICAFFAMLLLVPPLQIMRDRRARKKGKNPDEAKRYRKPENENGDVLGKISGIGGRMAAKSPWAVLGAVAIIVAGFGYSATNMSYSFDMYEFIPDGTEAYDTLNYLNDNYTISQGQTSVLIYDDGWDVDTIRGMELSLQNMHADTERERIPGIAYIDKDPDATYVSTILAQINASMMPGGLPGYDVVFDANGMLNDYSSDPVMAATQQAILRGWSDPNDPSAAPLIAATASVASYHNGEPVTRMIFAMTGATDGNDDLTIEMKDRINEACQPLADAGLVFVTTGQAIVLSVTMKEMNTSQMTALVVTIAFVLLILTIFMYYIDRSLLLGIMATIPTLISVVMVWGTMALLDIPMNVMTLTIASLTVGMGVTYGIHISHRYVTELIHNDLDSKEAIKKATRETGKGVFAAAITTIAGFGVMVFSKILPMYQFGLITALAIAFGYLGAVFVLPSLLVIWGKYSKPKIVERFNTPFSERPRPDTSAHRMEMPQGMQRPKKPARTLKLRRYSMR